MLTVFRDEIDLAIFDANINGNTVHALTHQHPPMTLAGILFSIFVVISEDEHALGDNDIEGAELLRRTVVTSFAISAVLLVVKVVTLALALLDFPLVLGRSLLVLTLQS